jgi:hypothetical protein
LELLVRRSLLSHSKLVTCGIKIKAKIAANNLPEVVLHKWGVRFSDYQQHMPSYCVFKHKRNYDSRLPRLQTSHVLHMLQPFAFEDNVTQIPFLLFQASQGLYY